MSAFVVGTDTMHSVVAALRPDVADLDALNKIGRDLYAMNIKAVTQRYPDCAPADMPGPIDQSDIGEGYRFNPVVATPCKVARYKAVSCLLYQCSEGDVPETALFKFLSERLDRLAHDIVASLPAYNRAGWDA